MQVSGTDGDVDRITGCSGWVRRGGWARPLLLWAARRHGGLRLREIGEAAGGRDYTAVAMAIKRLEDRAAQDAGLRRKMREVDRHCEM